MADRLSPEARSAHMLTTQGKGSGGAPVGDPSEWTEGKAMLMRRVTRRLGNGDGE
jgi:hypothetical protein